MSVETARRFLATTMSFLLPRMLDDSPGLLCSTRVQARTGMIQSRCSRQQPSPISGSWTSSTSDDARLIGYEAPTTARTSTSFGRLWRSPRDVLRDGLSAPRTLSLLEAELDRAIAALHHKARGFEAHLTDLGLRRLDKREAFLFLRSLVNLDPVVRSTAAAAPETYLDYFIADSPVECHRDHLVVGHRRVKALSMKEPPSQTFAHVLADLYAVPGEFIACLEWQRVPSDRMRRDIQTRRRHFFNKRVSLVNVRLSLCAAACRRLLPFGAPKGQEKGNAVLCTTTSRLPLEPPRQSLRGLIQPIIETGKPCLAKAGPSRHVSERRQVDAVEPSQPVSFGQLPGRPA